MGLLGTTDCDELLTSLGGGETASLGGTEVPCIVGAADAELLERGMAGAPVDVITRALVVTVRTGALAGLVVGATVTIRGAAHRVDQLVRQPNDALTKFLAFPS